VCKHTAATQAVALQALHIFLINAVDKLMDPVTAVVLSITVVLANAVKLSNVNVSLFVLVQQYGSLWQNGTARRSNMCKRTAAAQAAAAGPATVTVE
jgi:hypothetical protein